MTIERVVIHNFRGVVSADIRLEPYSLLIGANNSGKSTIMDAIRFFCDPRLKFDKDRDLPMFVSLPTKDNESWVELALNFQDYEITETLRKNMQSSGKMVLRKYFLSNDRKSGIYCVDESGAISESQFYGAKNIPEGSLFDVLYVPALRNVSDYTKLSGASELRELLGGILEPIFESKQSQSYSTFNEAVAAFQENLKTERTNDSVSLRGFADEFNNEIKDWGASVDFSLKRLSAGDILKNLIILEVKDGLLNGCHDVSQYGAGFQRKFIFTLLRLRSRYEVRNQDHRRELPRMTLLLFEEPEAFLHMDQQNELARNLIELSKHGMQVLCTTHSPNFVCRSLTMLPALINVVKRNGPTKVYQIAKSDVEKFLDQSMSCPNNDGDGDIALIKYQLLLNPNRASAFFARFVILVEGTSEEVLVNRMIDDGILRLPTGTVVLECLGKFNMPRMMFLLDRLGVRHAIIHDRDETEGQKGWNAFIKDHRTPNTMGIDDLYPAPDLERFLGLKKDCGLSKSKAKYAKPQELLRLYDNKDGDGIPQERKRAFAERLMKLAESGDKVISGGMYCKQFHK